MWVRNPVDLLKSEKTGVITNAVDWRSRRLQGKTTYQGLPVSIENERGSIRQGVSEDGHEWRTFMHMAYGYIRATEGTDGDHVDCYIGPNQFSSAVFVIHQQDPKTKVYDEDKVMLGYNSPSEAKHAYCRQYDSPGFFQSMSVYDMATFKAMLKERVGMKLKKSSELADSLKHKGKYRVGKGMKKIEASQLAMGIRVEAEHTDDKAVARQIALDHLQEDPEYYTHLAEMEAKYLKKSKRMPIGTISHGRKKLAERKWRELPKGRIAIVKQEPAGHVRTPGTGYESEPLDRNAFRIQNALRKYVTDVSIVGNVIRVKNVLTGSIMGVYNKKLDVIGDMLGMKHRRVRIVGNGMVRSTDWVDEFYTSGDASPSLSGNVATKYVVWGVAPGKDYEDLLVSERVDVNDANKDAIKAKLTALGVTKIRLSKLEPLTDAREVGEMFKNGLASGNKPALSGSSLDQYGGLVNNRITIPVKKLGWTFRESKAFAVRYTLSQEGKEKYVTMTPVFDVEVMYKIHDRLPTGKYAAGDFEHGYAYKGEWKEWSAKRKAAYHEAMQGDDSYADGGGDKVTMPRKLTALKKKKTVTPISALAIKDIEARQEKNPNLVKMRDQNGNIEYVDIRDDPILQQMVAAKKAKKEKYRKNIEDGKAVLKKMKINTVQDIGKHQKGGESVHAFLTRVANADFADFFEQELMVSSWSMVPQSKDSESWKGLI